MALSILAEEEVLTSLDLSHLRLMSIGGAPSDKALLLSLQHAFPRATVLQFYGMTECGNIFTRRTAMGRFPPIDSLGVPAKNINVRLGENDADDIGELYVNTPTMMDGYNSGRDATRLKNGWLRTGDVFTRDESGFYYFKGRADDMFVSGGENVFPAEVENILLKNPDVKVVCVCAVPSIGRGQAPVAFVVKDKNSSLGEIELLEFYDKIGPAFARPEYVLFRSRLPLNQTGKIDRLALSRELQGSLSPAGSS
jgi:acyl-CoA synthetase (AMP-forming)/AMP-acid ligase II